MVSITDAFGIKQELEFYRKATKKETYSCQSGFRTMPVKEGYKRVFMAYRTEGNGKGYYYQRQINE